MANHGRCRVTGSDHDGVDQCRKGVARHGDEAHVLQRDRFIAGRPEDDTEVTDLAVEHRQAGNAVAGKGDGSGSLCKAESDPEDGGEQEGEQSRERPPPEPIRRPHWRKLRLQHDGTLLRSESPDLIVLHARRRGNGRWASNLPRRARATLHGSVAGSGRHLGWRVRLCPHGSLEPGCACLLRT